MKQTRALGIAYLSLLIGHVSEAKRYNVAVFVPADVDPARTVPAMVVLAAPAGTGGTVGDIRLPVADVKI